MELLYLEISFVTDGLGLPRALVVEGPPASTGHRGSIPRLGTSPGGGQGSPLQYSCLKNPMSREAWLIVVHRIAKSHTQLKRLSMRAHALMFYMLQISRLSLLGCLYYFCPLHFHKNVLISLSNCTHGHVHMGTHTAFWVEIAFSL